jgi:hypothetical protein
MATCLREALRRRQGTPLAAFFNIPIKEKFVDQKFIHC